MTYIIDLQRLWQDKKQITASSLQIGPGAYLDPRHITISVIMVVYKKIPQLSSKMMTLLKDPFVREIQWVNCTGEQGDWVNALVQQHPKCFMVEGSPELSLVEAYQTAVRRASGLLLLFLDPQITLSHTALVRLATTGLRKPHPWAVGLQSESLNIFPRQHTPAAPLPEVFLSGGGIHVPALSPTCFLIPTTDYWELKGLDARCSLSAFHLDLCMRIHLAGGGVYQATEMSAEISAPYTQQQQTWRQKWDGIRGWWRYYQKHHSKQTNFFLGFDKVIVGLRLLGRLLGTKPQR